MLSNLLHFLTISFRIHLQIRGIIPAEYPFPLTSQEAEEASKSQLEDIVAKAYSITTNKRSEIKQQRQEAFLEAFYSLPRDLLKELQKVVQTDCDMFGFECDIDRRFDLRKKPDRTKFHLDDIVMNVL